VLHPATVYASRNQKLIHGVHVLVIHTSPIFVDKKNFYEIAKPKLYDNKIEHKSMIDDHSHLINTYFLLHGIELITRRK